MPSFADDGLMFDQERGPRACKTRSYGCACGEFDKAGSKCSSALWAGPNLHKWGGSGNPFKPTNRTQQKQKACGLGAKGVLVSYIPQLYFTPIGPFQGLGKPNLQTHEAQDADARNAFQTLQKPLHVGT